MVKVLNSVNNIYLDQKLLQVTELNLTGADISLNIVEKVTNLHS